MARLENKVALITGAVQGIGKAIAESFLREGAVVYLCDIQNEAGEKLAQLLGEHAHYIALDVRLEKDWQQAIAAIAANHDRLDIVVNNAGITGFAESSGPHDPENLDMESFHGVMATNLDGTVLGCKYGLQNMKERGGSIINISSRSGMVGIPGAAAYAASKAAVRNHSKTVALYAAEQGYAIRCNSVHPAAILTPMWDPMLGKGAEREKALAAIGRDVPLGHIGMPRDVAECVVYLASDESRYVTGTELTIDGGILAGSAASPSKKN